MKTTSKTHKTPKSSNLVKTFSPLTAFEKKWCSEFTQFNLLPGNQGKPLCLVNVWQLGKKDCIDVEFWDNIVKTWKSKFRFWQIGLMNDPAIEGCEYYFLERPSKKNFRKILSLIQNADSIIGIDSIYIEMAKSSSIPFLLIESNKTEPTKLMISEFLKNRTKK